MDLQTLFYPKSIAVIGASTKEGSVGNDVFKNLLFGYQGEVYPINLNAETVLGRRAYASIKAVPSEVDLAVVVVPAKTVPAVLKEAGEKKVKAAIVISAGFKERGGEGAELEEEVKKVCLDSGIALVGPNCLGVINPQISMNASFAASMPKEGKIAFISQSGALCSSVIDYANSLGIGFSKFVSVGNKACLDEADFLLYFADDPQTKVILIYAEQFKNSPKLISAVNRVIRSDNPKPIIVLKAGRTAAGATASTSHTGALGGDDKIYEGFFSQNGMIRVYSVEEFFNCAVAFANNPPAQGKRIAIVSNAGGPAILATDALVEKGLELAQLSPETINGLKMIFPPASNINNPIDVLGDARSDRYRAAIDFALKDKNVDGLLIILTPQTTTEIEATAQVIIEAKKNSIKPIIVSFMGQSTVESGVKLLKEAGVAQIAFPDEAGRVMASLVKFYQNVSEPKGDKFVFADLDKVKVVSIMIEAKSRGQTFFPEVEAREIIEAYGLPLLKSRRASSIEEAVAAAKELGGKVAMKIISKDIVHRTDVGGVMLDVKPEEVANRFNEMIATVSAKVPQAKLDGVLLMEMAPSWQQLEDGGGLEVVLGVKKDPNLGHAIMFGLGGIYIEVLKDVTFRLAPLTRKDAEVMIKSIRSAKIFEGIRGRRALDKKALIDAIGRLSQLVIDFPQIKELDLNPILVLPEGRGIKVLDARILIE